MEVGWISPHAFLSVRLISVLGGPHLWVVVFKDAPLNRHISLMDATQGP